MPHIHPPKAKQIHNLPQRSIRLKKLNRPRHRKHDLRVLAHKQRMYRARILDDVVPLMS